MDKFAGAIEKAALGVGGSYLLAEILANRLPLGYGQVLRAVQAGIASQFNWLFARLDTSLKTDLPSTIFLKAVFASLATCWIFRTATKASDATLKQGVIQTILAGLKKIPGVSGLVKKEKEKIYKKMADQVVKGRYEGCPVPKFAALPQKPLTFDECMETIDDVEAKDQKFDYDGNKLSGAVYFKSKEHAEFQSKVYSRFIATNAIFADSFPSVARMDAELISMTASLVKDPNKKVKPVGAVTSGGSESILCAMKASRDWWLENNSLGFFRNLVETLPWRKSSFMPEIIIADSAHAAYVKAAEYYNLKMVVIPCGENVGYRLTAEAVKKRITPHTAIIVVSAPTYPHGVVDEIEQVGRLAAKNGIAMHVDACLGGYVLPFARDAGFARPGFHFGMEGITSISMDIHKYGLAHKGTSVILYRHKEIRKHQFTRVTDWTGGLYISPTMAGSRSGAVIAAAWSCLLTVGREGFVNQTKHLLTLADKLTQGVESIEDLKLLGKPDCTVIAWGAKNPKALDMYLVNDMMTKRGWHLATLQRPAGAHMCLAPAHTSEMIDDLVADLKECVDEVKKGPKDGEEGMAKIYGMAEGLPDRHIIGDVLVAYQEAALDS